MAIMSEPGRIDEAHLAADSRAPCSPSRNSHRNFYISRAMYTLPFHDLRNSQLRANTRRCKVRIIGWSRAEIAPRPAFSRRVHRSEYRRKLLPEVKKAG